MERELELIEREIEELRALLPWSEPAERMSTLEYIEELKRRLARLKGE